nr:cytochrome p450 4v2 [Quercus suber]
MPLKEYAVRIGYELCNVSHNALESKYTTKERCLFATMTGKAAVHKCDLTISRTGNSNLLSVTSHYLYIIECKMLSSSSFTISVLVGIVFAAFLLVYRSFLPKPIPGIPYDKKSAARILGDAPDAMKYQAKTGEILSYLKLKCKELDSPIIQMFMRPGGAPWVIMTDGREAHDIMTRRTREFDRSKMFADMLISLYPNTHIIMKTNDQWRWNRRLVADAMSPDFLNNVATHMVYEQTQVLIDLWRQKARLCSGHVVDVLPDVVRCTVDAMFAATFGVGLGTNKSQGEYLSGLNTIDVPKSSDTVIRIPEHGLPSSWSAFLDVFKSSELAVSSPLGRTAHSLRKSIKVRERIVQNQVKQAWKTFGTGDDAASIDKVKCIVDLLVAKEAKLAKKEGRVLDRNSKYLVDELSGFIVAGFDTTAATLSWGFKYLTARQDVQHKIRQELRSTFRESLETSRQPSAEEFSKSRLPYLDAFSEEVLRHCCVVPANVRETMHDAVVLGHVIPRGVDIYMLTTGPSMMEPAMSVDESKRSVTSKEYKGDMDEWYKSSDIGEFRPERWLKVDEKGNSEYDPRAAPMQAFGSGLRSCFGPVFASYLQRASVLDHLLVEFLELHVRNSIRNYDEPILMQRSHGSFEILPPRRPSLNSSPEGRIIVGDVDTLRIVPNDSGSNRNGDIISGGRRDALLNRMKSDGQDAEQRRANHGVPGPLYTMLDSEQQQRYNAKAKTRVTSHDVFPTKLGSENSTANKADERFSVSGSRAL